MCEPNFPQILLNSIFQRILWISIFHKSYGIQLSTYFTESIIHKILWETTFHFYDIQFSTFYIEFNFPQTLWKQLSTVEVQNLVDHPVRSSNSRTSAAVLYKPFQLRAIWQRSVDPIATNCLLIFFHYSALSLSSILYIER